ncbi:AAA family ATPase, partial [Klebsiella pneumoniae]
NTNHAQLIFTTHETSILRRDLLRRDQIWFCEKSNNKSTTVYPLTSFSPRKDREDIEESYLSGLLQTKALPKGVDRLVTAM